MRWIQVTHNVTFYTFFKPLDRYTSLSLIFFLHYTSISLSLLHRSSTSTARSLAAKKKKEKNAAAGCTTRISYAREYHMLLRHLAYHHALLDTFQYSPYPLVSLPLFFPLL